MSRSTRLATVLVVGLLVVTAASAGFAVAQDAGGSVGDTTQDAENTTSDTTDTTDETAERTTADEPSTSDATTETTDTASDTTSSTGDATSDSETTTTDSGTESDTASNSETPTASETETDVASADTTDSSAETKTSDASTAGTDASAETVPADTDETASTETTEAATTDATTSNSNESNSGTDSTGDVVETVASTATNGTNETNAATETAGQSADSETVGSAGDTVTNETGTQQPETETPVDTNQSSADAADPTVDATEPSTDATTPTADSSPSVNDSADGTPETGTGTQESKSTPDADSGSVQDAMDSAGQVADDENQTATDTGDAPSANGGAVNTSTGDDTGPVEAVGLEVATEAASALTDAADSSRTPDSTTSSNDSQLSDPVSNATTEPPTETDLESSVDESTETVANSSVNQSSEAVSDSPVDKSFEAVSSSTLDNLSEAVSDSAVDESSEPVDEIKMNVNNASNETLTSPTGVESVTGTAAQDVGEKTSDVGDELTIESVTGDELQVESTTDEVTDADLTSADVENTDVPMGQDSLTNDALDTGDSELGSTDDANLPSISSVSGTESVLDTETVDTVSGSELTGEVASFDADSNPVDGTETVTDTVDVENSTTDTVELDSVSTTATQDSTTIQSLDESAQTTLTFDAVDETAEIVSTDLVEAEQITLASNDLTKLSADAGQTTTEAGESLDVDESTLSVPIVESLQEPVTGSASRSLSSAQVEGETLDTVSELGTPVAETNAGQVTPFADEPLDTTASTVDSLDDAASRNSANAQSTISEPFADDIQSSAGDPANEAIPSVSANNALSERAPIELEESVGISSVDGLSDRSSSMGVPISVDHVDSRPLGSASTLGQRTEVTDQRDLDVDARQFDVTTDSFDVEPVDDESVDNSELDSAWAPSKSDSAPRSSIVDNVDLFTTGDFDQQLLGVPLDASESASFGALFGVSALTIGFAARRFFGDPLTAMPGLVAINSQAMFLHARTAISNAWPRVLPFPGYSRYDQSDPLENDARNVVYETIEQSPGAYMTELSENANIPRSTVRYHVRVLEEEGLVSGAKVRGKRRFYPVGVDDVDIVAALEDDATAAILDAISRLGPATGSRLADELDRDPSTVSHHLSRLEDASLVERTRDGGAVVNHLTPDAKEALLNADTPPEASDSSRTVNA